MVTSLNPLQRGVQPQQVQTNNSLATGLTAFGRIASSIGEAELQRRQEKRIVTDITSGMMEFEQSLFNIEKELNQSNLRGPEYYNEYHERANQVKNRIIENTYEDSARQHLERTLGMDTIQRVKKAYEVSEDRERRYQLSKLQNTVNGYRNLYIQSTDFEERNRFLKQVEESMRLSNQYNGLDEETNQRVIADELDKIRFAGFENDLVVDPESAVALLESGAYGFKDKQYKTDAMQRSEAVKRRVEAEAKRKLHEDQVINSSFFYDQIRNGGLDYVEDEFGYFLDKALNGTIDNSHINGLAGALHNRKQVLQQQVDVWGTINSKLDRGMQLDQSEADTLAALHLQANNILPDEKRKSDALVLAEADNQSKQLSSYSENMLASASRATSANDPTLRNALDYIGYVNELNPRMLNDVKNIDMTRLHFYKESIDAYGDFEQGFNAAFQQMDLKGEAQYDFRVQQASDLNGDISRRFDTTMDEFTESNIFSRGLGQRLGLDFFPFNVNYPIGAAIDYFISGKKIPEWAQSEVKRKMVDAYGLTGNEVFAAKHGMNWFQRNYALNTQGEWEKKPLNAFFEQNYQSLGSGHTPEQAWDQFKDIVFDEIKNTDSWKNSGYGDIQDTKGSIQDIIEAAPEMGMGKPRPQRFEDIFVFKPIPRTTDRRIPDYYIQFKKKDEPNVLITVVDEEGKFLAVHGMESNFGNEKQQDIWSLIKKRFEEEARRKDAMLDLQRDLPEVK